MSFRSGRCRNPNGSGIFSPLILTILCSLLEALRKKGAFFFRTMRMLRSQYGVLWGVNTGRDPVYLREGLADMFRDDAEAFAPDFTVTMRWNVHLADAEGRLMPGAAWNDDCAVAHDSLFTRYGGMLESLMGQLESRFSGWDSAGRTMTLFPWWWMMPAAWMKFPASFRIRLESV